MIKTNNPRESTFLLINDRVNLRKSLTVFLWAYLRHAKFAESYLINENFLAESEPKFAVIHTRGVWVSILEEQYALIG